MSNLTQETALQFYSDINRKFDDSVNSQIMAIAFNARLQNLDLENLSTLLQGPESKLLLLNQIMADAEAVNEEHRAAGKPVLPLPDRQDLVALVFPLFQDIMEGALVFNQRIGGFTQEQVDSLLIELSSQYKKQYSDWDVSLDADPNQVYSQKIAAEDTIRDNMNEVMAGLRK